MGLSPDEVTACLVTRGDQPAAVKRICESLIFERIIVWDNSQRDDMKTAGRYWATGQATTPVVYYQDDDVIVPRTTQLALLEAYEPGVPTAVYAHGENAGGYDDLPLVGAGALVDRGMPMEAMRRYIKHGGSGGDSFLYYCDFAIGVLYPRFKHLHLPFEILPVAQDPSRLCNQPWAADMKLEVTERARAIRDIQVAA